VRSFEFKPGTELAALAAAVIAKWWNGLKQRACRVRHINSTSALMLSMSGPIGHSALERDRIVARPALFEIGKDNDVREWWSSPFRSF
jgi:hypothetical protein